jgi:hypothetical protein
VATRESRMGKYEWMVLDIVGVEMFASGQKNNKTKG